jgi:lipopolysaccharide/colanic/teichoic acid biosynthesis glycosyltransferase
MTRKHSFYEKYIKRILDFLLSLFALIILSIPMLAVAILVRIKLGAPVIFCQERPGKNEKIFKLYKFRTMTDARDENGELLPDEVRLTKFGKFLRSTSLDELPELWNILKGEMSIVGPRPLLVSYLPYYTEEERKRHCVSPGLTGLAQVNGRNNLTWEEKFAYDLEYVNRISFTTDVKIIIKTALKVFIRADVQADTQSIEGNLAKIRQSLQTEKTENEHFDSKLRD